MNIFLDMSSLFKLYHQEADTAEFEQKLSATKISSIYLSEIAKVEFASTIWKKVRTKEISEIEARTTLDLFESDFQKYNFTSERFWANPKEEYLSAFLIRVSLCNENNCVSFLYNFSFLQEEYR